MAIKASPDIIRAMDSDIKKAADELDQIGNGIRRKLDSLSGWDDPQAESYRELMMEIARLTKEPVSVLEDVRPALHELIEALEEYNNVRF